MRAIECRALGPPSVPLGEGGLHLSEKPAPTLAGKRAPHAVRIKASWMSSTIHDAFAPRCSRDLEGMHSAGPPRRSHPSFVPPSS